MKRRNKPFFAKKVAGRIYGEAKKNKTVFAVFVILRILVITIGVFSALAGNYWNCFLCILSLVLFLIPSFVTKNLGIHLPEPLEIIVLLFIFAAEILGEISSFYVRVPHWDTMLHTVNGFLCAAIGFALVDILNRSSKIKFQLSPFYLAIVAFCFSMTVGVLWEFFEFFMDYVFLMDMQKDTVVYALPSVTFDTTMSNDVVVIDAITNTIVQTSDGTLYNFADYGINGYLDMGVIDTMKDLFVNFIGAVVFSAIGYVYVKTRGKGKIAKGLIPTLKDDGAEMIDAEF